MFKTYLRLLNFAKPLSRYTVPYFFFAAFHALFNTFNYAMIIPILNAMFSADGGFVFTPVYVLPEITINEDGLNTVVSFIYTHFFGEEFVQMKFLAMLGGVLVCMNLFSNLFRYAAAMTVESLRINTLRRMRDEMFSRVLQMNVGYFSDQRKGDIMSKITQDVMVVQYCITNTLQVAFRDPFLIIGYLVLMIGISWQLSLFAVIFLPIVGVIIGGAFGKIVTSVVNDLIMPTVGMLVGGVNFTDLKLTMKEAVPEKLNEAGEVIEAAVPAVTLNYGNFLQTTFDFLIIAFCIFLMVKGIAKLTTKKKEEPKPATPPAPPAPSAEEKLLTEIRDLLKNK